MSYHTPKQSSVVVYDESRFEYFRDYILNNITFSIYQMRPERIHLNPIIIYYLIKNILFFNWRKINNSFSGRLLDYYRYSIFLIISPKVVLTFNDNSGSFGRLSKSYSQAKFIAIQNGKRNSILFTKNLTLSHKHYYCFGRNDIDFLKKNKHKIKHYYPYGSLRVGISMEIYDELLKPDNYDICIVSIWRPWKNESHSGYKSNYQDIWDTFDHTNAMIKKYLLGKQLSVCIAMRSATSTEDNYEKEYWNKQFGGEVKLIPNDIINLSSFKAVQASTIILGVASTLILEAFGMGKKALYCDFTDSVKYVNYNSSLVFRDNNYNKFANRLNELISEPYEDYINKNKKYASYLMNNDVKNPPHLIIRKMVEQSLI